MPDLLGEKGLDNEIALDFGRLIQIDLPEEPFTRLVDRAKVMLGVRVVILAERLETSNLLK